MSPRPTKVWAVRMPPGTPRSFPGFLLPAHRVGQLLVVVDHEHFGVRPRDGFLPVGDQEGAQLVDRFGEGTLVGRGLRVACHVQPVGEHPRRRRVADEAAVEAVEEGHVVAAEPRIWHPGHPVQLTAGSGEESVEAHGHGEDELGHDCLLSWLFWRKGWRRTSACQRRVMASARFLTCARLLAAMSVNAAHSGTVIATAALWSTTALMMDAPAMSAASPRPRRARPATG